MQKISSASWAAFIAVSFFWGTTFLAIRVALEAFPPFTLGAIRHSVAGILFISYFRLRGHALPTLKQIPVFAVNGFLMLTLGNGLVNYSEQYISSGLAALLCTFSPLAILLVNAVFGSKEKISTRVYWGIALCAIAQILIFKDNVHELFEVNYLSGVIAVLVAVLAWSFGSVYSKNHQTSVSPLMGAGFQMFFGGFFLSLYVAFTGEYHQIHTTQAGIWSLFYLIGFGSLVGYGAFILVLKKMPTAIASSYAYVNTVVAVLLGWLFLEEKLSIWMVAAVALTIIGLYIVNRSIRKPSEAESA